MLTVKHVEKSGHESVTPTTSIAFDPATGENKEYPRGQLLAFGIDTTVAGYNRYASGTVYVMNDNGSTVARYDFD